jgi:LysM repeat protein
MRPQLAFIACLLLAVAPLAAAEPLYHVLAKGETVYGLSRTFKVPVDAILAANGISDPAKVRIGQKLLIPAVHTVGKGDTLFSIGRLYSVSVDEIRKLNHLAAGAVIVPGQVLVLPASAARLASSSPATGTQGSAGSGGSSGGQAKPGGSATASSSGSGNSGSGAGDPTYPPLVKTSAKAVDPKLLWPCSGEARYLDGKIDGVMILTDRGVAAKAIAAGRVVSAGPYRGFGQVVFVETRTGHIYVYGGNESLSVRVGDSIRLGQEVGKVGYDAKEGRAVAYFFVFKEGASLDPAKVPRG